MALSVGDRIGIYQIVAPIGRGGMGEVYRARDTRLERDVAIKVLPAAVADDPERLARFEREAKVLAALNHPNIATIYGREDRAIVMELVEGPTLAARLKSGPLAPPEVISIAQQIVAALEAAHDKGIVHRDLKPANVKAPVDAPVKVLDFGLATVVESAPAEPAADRESSTRTMGATQPGMVVGTAAYMSPEQAAGRPADKRADIWSFGVVLWEMLTGKRLFGGGSDAISRVLGAPIPFQEVPAGLLRQLLERCLDRDVKTRLRDIGEARVALGNASQPVLPPVPSRSAKSAVAWTVAAAAIVVASALAAIHFRETPPAPRSVRFQIAPPEGLTIANFQLSPDGRYLAFTAARANAPPTLWVRALDEIASRELPGTEGAALPFWSPDSEFIAFYAGGSVRKVARAGGTPVALAQTAGMSGGDWSSDDVILFSSGNGVVLRVPAKGGIPEKAAESGLGPVFLPDRRFLFQNAEGVRAAPLDGGPAVTLRPTAFGVVYSAPVAPGSAEHLLFVAGDTLFAQPFDGKSLKFTGDPFPVAEGTRWASVSREGTLAYRAGFSDNWQLVWMDRTGKHLGNVAQPFENGISAARLSPDDSRVAVNPGLGATADIWLADLRRGNFSRFTTNGSTTALWSADGARLVVKSLNGVYLRNADGSTPANEKDDGLLFRSLSPGFLRDWSRDGKLIAYHDAPPGGSQGIWMVSLERDRKPFPYSQSTHSQRNPVFSPDGKWLAYDSDESGRREVWVESIPAGRGRWQVSTNGGAAPQWRRDGTELYYAQGTKIMVTSIRTTPTTVEAGTPREVFDAGENASSFQMTSDGQRFLMTVKSRAQSSANAITIVTNWQSGFQK